MLLSVSVWIHLTFYAGWGVWWVAGWQGFRPDLNYSARCKFGATLEVCVTASVLTVLIRLEREAGGACSTECLLELTYSVCVDGLPGIINRSPACVCGVQGATDSSTMA